jgi:hypothetical protein
VTRCIPLLALAAFAAGRGLAGDGDGGGAGDGGRAAADIRTLVARQKRLYGDLAKIEQAVKDMNEIRQMRESGQFVLNDEEEKLEKRAKVDFHIFMERYRNDTLRVLAVLDRLLGKEQYTDPLRKRFGKAFDDPVKVEWNEVALDEIVSELVAAYGVKMFVRGEVDSRKTMSLEGELSLKAILLQIENVFDAQLVERNGELWFVGLGSSPDADEE